MGLNIGLQEDLNSVGIQQLWIISKSGLCALHLNFTRKETIDESLVGGFFSVITSLIQASSADDNLEVISLKSAIIYYKNVNDLDFSIVIATNRNTKKKIIAKILDRIASSFYIDFNHLATEKRSLLSDEIFYPFSTKVVEIINNKGKIKKQRLSFIDRVQTMVKA